MMVMSCSSTGTLNAYMDFRSLHGLGQLRDEAERQHGLEPHSTQHSALYVSVGPYDQTLRWGVVGAAPQRVVEQGGEGLVWGAQQAGLEVSQTLQSELVKRLAVLTRLLGASVSPRTCPV